MKLRATVAGQEFDIQIHQDDGRVSAEINGRSYEVEMHDSGDNCFLLRSGGKVFDCRVDGTPESGRPVDVFVGTGFHVVTLTDPRRFSSATAASGHGDAKIQIIAPMPGKIVRIMVRAGDRVEANDGLVVVEAMKMQNEMKSPKAGTVVTLNVETGATVNGGDVLAVIE
jgi:biotin carboxyl carrier protein